jgi:hypothetical protein
LGGLAAPENAHVIGLDKINGLYVTESDTLGITVANVALQNPTIDGIEIHCAKRANADAGPAANTGIIVNSYAPQLFIPRYGLDRTNVQTGRILALLTRHGNIYAFGLPFHHPNPASGRIGYAIVRNRANQLTESATRAFFVIDV